MDDSHPEQRPSQTPERPLVKRRWAVFRRASGGTAVIAVAGALALGDAADNVNPDLERAGGNSHISADA